MTVIDTKKQLTLEFNGERFINGRTISFIRKDGERIFVEKTGDIAETKQNGFLVFGESFACDKAEYTVHYAVYGPSCVFAVVRFCSDEPLKLSESFFIKNCDGALNTHVASERRLVFRRGEAAMKFFTFPTSGEVVYEERRENGDDVFSYTDAEFSNDAVRVYAMTPTPIDIVGWWHLYPDGDGAYRILSPRDEEIWRLELSDNGQGFILSKTK